MPTGWAKKVDTALLWITRALEFEIKETLSKINTASVLLNTKKKYSCFNSITQPGSSASFPSKPCGQSIIKKQVLFIHVFPLQAFMTCSLFAFVPFSDATATMQRVKLVGAILLFCLTA